MMHRPLNQFCGILSTVCRYCIAKSTAYFFIILKLRKLFHFYIVLDSRFHTYNDVMKYKNLFYFLEYNSNFFDEMRV